MPRSQSGFTLVEVLVSIVILSVLALSLMSIFSKSLQITSSDLDRTVANQIAQNTLHTIERRASDSTASFDLTSLTEDSSGQCDLCHMSINGRDFDITISSPETTDTFMNISIVVDSETLLNPITLKGVITHASLREKFPETSNPEASTP